MANLSDLLTTTSGVAGPLSGGLFKEVTDGSRYPYMIPTIYTVNVRAESNANGWSNADSWTNFYVYGGAGAPDAERLFWHGLATYRQSAESYHDYSGAIYRELQWAGANVVGTDNMFPTISNNTSYAPFGVRLMFIRNFHPSVAIGININWQISQYWSSGYDGSAMYIGIPNNAGGTMANCSGINWTTLWQLTGNNTWNYGAGANVTIPANTSAVLILANTMFFWTSYSSYFFYDRNAFNNLDNVFANNWIQPDLRLTWTAWTYNQVNDFSYNNYTSYQVWNRAAALYGDR